IRRIAGEAALPVTTLNLDELQKAGVTNAEQAIKFITQQQGGQVTSSSVSSTNGAAAYADLRSIGAQRTLVLLNGKRVAANPFNVVGTDLNTLPLSAISRIEVLPDGASSIYGTDAVSGVINFITRKDYRGATISATAQVTAAGGGDVSSGTVLGGVGDIGSQGWNLLGGLNVRDQKPMSGVQRDFSKTSYQPELGFNATSPTAFPANYSQSGTVSTANPASPTCAPPGSISVPETSGARIRCFADTQVFTNTIPIQDQYSLFLRGSLALGQDNVASLEYFKSYNHVRTRIAPSPESGLTMNPSSPYYPGNGITPANPALDKTRPISIAWRTTALGSREGEQKNNTQRLVAALEGSVAGWNYQVSALTSNAKVENFFLNGYPMTQPLRNGVAGLAGAPLLNPFGEQSAAGLAYLVQNQVLGKVQDGESKMSSAAATVSRPLMQLPGGPLTLALAAESRKEEMVYNTDIAKVSQAASSGLAGSGALRQGSRDISALAAELVVPVMKGLELGFSVRGDKYSDFGSTVDPKVSVRYQPNETVLLRGSANKGFVAPSLYQLYLPNSTTFTATRYNDPVLCPNGVPTSTAVPSRDCGLQFQQLQGGNAGLAPEKSHAWTAGLVLQPTSQFSFGFDYWSYYIKNSISTIGEQSIFADPAKYAALFVRCSQAPAARQAAIGACQVPGGDPLAYIINTFLNLGDIRTSGVDLQANWNSGSTANGRFKVSARGSYVTKYEFQVEPRGIWFNPNGNYNAQFGGPVIRYQQVTTFGWEKGPWSTLVSNRIQSGYRDQNSQGAPFNVAPFNTHRVGDYTLFDASLSYTGIKNLTLQAGVLNLFDTDPPFTNQVSRFQARGYDDRFHNPLGRTYQVSARYEF
ncbi:MAG: TonB-dependent receptor, partial [Burkholderiales bacterium]|nr:TonB-dependent receptor [Burkholderiales bacterium]